MKKIRLEAGKLLGEERISTRNLSRLLGKMNATTQMIPLAPPFCRYVQRCLNRSLDHSNQDYESVISLNQESIDELRWWSTEMMKWNGKALLRKEIDLVIMSDAFLTGWGAVSGRQRTGGPWSQEERTMHINCLESLAATLALKTFAKGRQGISVLLYLDNTTAVAYSTAQPQVNK